MSMEIRPAETGSGFCLQREEQSAIKTNELTRRLELADAQLKALAVRKESLDARRQDLAIRMRALENAEILSQELVRERERAVRATAAASDAREQRLLAIQAAMAPLLALIEQFRQPIRVARELPSPLSLSRTAKKRKRDRG